jgi:integrase
LARFQSTVRTLRESADLLLGRRQLAARTGARWLLSCHLLVFFRSHKLSAITPELVDKYRTAKLREREFFEAAAPEQQKSLARPLNNTSINKTLALLARILDEAVEYGLIGSNPSAGKRRRRRPMKPNRTWLEPHEVQAVLEAARKQHRVLLATMILAGRESRS